MWTRRALSVSLMRTASSVENLDWPDQFLDELVVVAWYEGVFRRFLVYAGERPLLCLFSLCVIVCVFVCCEV